MKVTLLGLGGGAAGTWTEDARLALERAEAVFGAPRLLAGRQVGFDVEVRAEQAAPQTRLARNDLARELYQMGFFRPDLADQALLALEMMDFEGIAAVRARIEANAAAARGGMSQ